MITYSMLSVQDDLYNIKSFRSVQFYITGLHERIQIHYCLWVVMVNVTIFEKVLYNALNRAFRIGWQRNLNIPPFYISLLQHTPF